MIRSLFVLPLLALAGVAAACSSSDDNGTTTPTGDAGSTNDASPTGDAGAALSFTPSNLDLSGIDLSNVGDYVVDQPNCEIYTTEKLATCGDTDTLAFGVVEQPNGGGKIGVYVARSIRVEPNASLLPHVTGAFPLALVALDTMDVQGVIDVSAHDSRVSAGGFKAPATESTKGSGPGGGTGGTTTNAAGGGAYCGVGGKGGSSDAMPTAGGASYGSPVIIPLTGGSSGGNGSLPFAGTGGGAVQLVAGKKFTLGANATVAANGGGGINGGTSSQHASGGGSGGSILIESPDASILGSLIANGGAGGSKSSGQDGQLDGKQAVGDRNTNGATGGSGSAQEGPDGVDGTWAAGDPAAGGGGGAGRIRINSTTGNVALSARRLSPSANGPCTTEGKLSQ